MPEHSIWDDLEEVKRRSRVPSSSPEVTVQRGGSLGLNKAAIEALEMCIRDSPCGAGRV